MSSDYNSIFPQKVYLFLFIRANFSYYSKIQQMLSSKGSLPSYWPKKILWHKRAHRIF